MNRLAGKEVFLAKKGARGVTSGFDRYTVLDHHTPFFIIDSIGLNDPKITINMWIERFKAQMPDVNLNLVVMIMKASDSASNEAISNFVLMTQAFKIKQ